MEENKHQIKRGLAGLAIGTVLISGGHLHGAPVLEYIGRGPDSEDLLTTAKDTAGNDVDHEPTTGGKVLSSAETTHP